MKVRLEEMTLKEVRDGAPYEAAVLPWGACEPHNMHLPYGCDAMTAAAIAEKSARKAKEKGARVVVLPVMPVGVNTNTLEFPLTLNLNPTTQLAILRDIVTALEHHGVNKFVLLNSHGGNNFKALLRELYGQTRVRLFLLDWWKLVGELAGEHCDDAGGEHGNEPETAWLMSIRPDLVHLEWADRGEVREPRLRALKEGWVWTTRPWHLLTTNAGHGNPAKATAAKGEKIVEPVTDRIAEFLLELSKAKVDDRFPY